MVFSSKVQIQLSLHYPSAKVGSAWSAAMERYWLF